MAPAFDAAEVRVLACLVEKEITTPEYYPLTLNALVNACNQKSNRDPVVSYSEDTVAATLDTLRHKGFTMTTTGAGNRVPKFSHRLQEKMNLGRRETAVLCELMLRGPQTVGEIRSRADRMHRFDDITVAESTVRGLMDANLAMELPRQPGTKEPRYAHLLSGPADATETVVIPQARADRVSALETEVAELRARLERLEQQWYSATPNGPAE